jgi:hypothetical protein
VEACSHPTRQLFNERRQSSVWDRRRIRHRASNLAGLVPSTGYRYCGIIQITIYHLVDQRETEFDARSKLLLHSVRSLLALGLDKECYLIPMFYSNPIFGEFPASSIGIFSGRMEHLGSRCSVPLSYTTDPTCTRNFKCVSAGGIRVCSTAS